MKFDFLQGDFSGGELSPRAQGHVDSDAYKAGLALAANVAPTRSGSLASRAGGKFLTDGLNAGNGQNTNAPVQHIAVHDGPNGDFVVQIDQFGLRMMDKFGVLDWNTYLNPYPALTYAPQDGAKSWGDPVSRTVYLNALAGNEVYLLAGTFGPNILNANLAGFPAGTNEAWTFSGVIAGDDATFTATELVSGTVHTFVLSSANGGRFSVTFTPFAAGTAYDFTMALTTVGGVRASKLWDLTLTKNGTKTSQDLSAFGLAAKPLGLERIRAASFWASGQFYVAFAGGPSNQYSGYCLRWTPNGTGSNLKAPLWEFIALPCRAGSLARIQKANTVVVYQNRLWYGINDASGGVRIAASAIGFGQVTVQYVSGVPATIHGTLLEFIFINEVQSQTYVGAPGAVVLPPFTFRVRAAADIISTKNGKVGTLTTDYTVALNSDQALNPGGQVTWLAGVGGDYFTVTRVAQATDPLDLNLATPASRIAWMNVLRGLMLGTSRTEKLFAPDQLLALDPSTGQSFSLDDESNLGSDPAVPALDINDRVLMVQRGRQVLRQVNISVLTSGGLVSEDVGVKGEHLTRPRVRALCFLKTPVQRVVLALDDGTGAVMTIGGHVGQAAGWSRFTLPAAFGGVYSVEALDGDQGTELFVGTENGVTLHWHSFESDIESRVLVAPQAFPLAPLRIQVDAENPLPPVMDGWVQASLGTAGGVQFVTGLSASFIGQNAWAYVNGQVQGPYPCVVDGAGPKAKMILPAALGLTSTWIDGSGARRPQDIYVGLAYPDHHWRSLPLEGGNPVGTSQQAMSRKPQLYLRFVDSYLPLVNGTRASERGPADPMDALGVRVSGDRRATEMGFHRGAVVEVSMDLPLRMEVSAIFGGAVMNNI